MNVSFVPSHLDLFVLARSVVLCRFKVEVDASQFAIPGGIRVTGHDPRQIGSKECTKVSRAR